MKRNALVVLLVFPLVFLAVHVSPAASLPTGHATEAICGGLGVDQATCWRYCCTAAGAYVHTLSGRGESSSCGAAQTKCDSCLPACNAGEVVCNKGGGCL